MLKTRKSAVRLLGNICEKDTKTVFGSNLRNIAYECDCGIDSLTPNIVKNVLTYFKCPDEEAWRIPLLLNLIDITVVVSSMLLHLDI